MNRLRIAICGALLGLLGLGVGPEHAAAKLRVPDHTYYGVVRVEGVVATAGILSVTTESEAEPIASFVYPSTPVAGGRYVLRVPLDTLDPQTAGTARPGDTLTFWLNGTAVGTTVLGQPGVHERLDLGETLPQLTVADVKVGLGGGLTQAIFTLRLSRAVPQTVRVDYATANGTAQAGVDYEALQGSIAFTPGRLSMRVVVNLSGVDPGPQGKTFFLNLSNPQGTELPDPQALCELTDEILLQVADLTVKESPAGTQTVLLTVRLSKPAGQAASVDFHTEDFTAAEGQDYQAASGQLQFAPGETRKSITLRIHDDQLAEEDELFQVRFTNPVNLMLPSEAKWVRILDNELMLHDQMDRASTTAIRSVLYTPNLTRLDAEAADDFTLQEGASITAVEVLGRYSKDPGAQPRMRVQFYQVGAGRSQQPGPVEASATRVTDAVQGDVQARLDGTDPVRLHLAFTEPVRLEAGTYWMSVQAELGADSTKRWFWVYQIPQNGSPFVYRNPGNGYAEGCTSWSPALGCPGVPGASLSFRLIGTETPTVGVEGHFSAAAVLIAACCLLMAQRRLVRAKA